MIPIRMEIESAMDAGQGLREVYAHLRLCPAFSERTALLRQAHELADTLGNCLRCIASLSSQNSQDGQTQDALRELGEMIEQVMVEEREYRIASGACSEEDIQSETSGEGVQ